MDKSNLVEEEEITLLKEEVEEMEGIALFVKGQIILLKPVIRSMAIHQTGEEVEEILMQIW
jgi:hypothetical protein